MSQSCAKFMLAVFSTTKLGFFPIFKACKMLYLAKHWGVTMGT